MKKNTLFFVCLLILAMVVSCKKENVDENILQARMTDFHTSKAYIDGANYSCFLNGEEILVNNENCTITPKQQDNNRSCDITNVTKADEYYAFYPSSLLAQNATISGGFNNVQVTLPQIQTFEYDNTLNKQIISNPMAGYLNASSGTILLQNLCALLKVTVYSTTNSTLRSIDVTLKGTTIWGTGSVHPSDWSLVMDPQQGHSTVTLSFGSTGRQGNPNGESFYIVVPKATIGTDNTNSVQVIIHGDYIASNSAVTSRTFQMGLSSNNDENIIPKNTITPLPEFRIGNPVTYNPNCVFTVEAAVNGKPARKVTFAPGNLVRNQGTDVWHFPGKPWNGVNMTNNNKTKYDYYWDYNNNMVGANAESDKGWCHSVAGSLIHTWRVPTRDEWIYILTANRNTKNNVKYVYQMVHYTKGIIIFPDNYNGTIPSARIDENTWPTYESLGCVFLPAHGTGTTKHGESSYNNGNGGNEGYYASANSFYNSVFTCIRFTSSGLSADEPVANKNGVNFRLVHDIVSTN